MAKRPPSACDPSARPLPKGLLGKIVRVHLNLHNGCYVVAMLGKVLGYTPALVLRDVSTHVAMGGYQRCRDEHTRNVHAYLQGTLTSAGELFDPPAGWQRVSYNCLTHPPCFYFTADGQCLVTAAELLALPRGQVWVRRT